MSRSDVEAVFVATTHDMLAPIATEAAKHGKHVFVEKPGAIFRRQLFGLAEAAESTGVRVRIGFNHRYHRHVRKAREIFESGALGEMMFIRARYGHGGRVGYEKEWRANPSQSGGGQLMDQCPHLIDLARWFLGHFVDVKGFAETYFWNMPVEDNVFLLLRTKEEQVASLQSSWSEWKNLFSFEIFGRWGKLELTGLGGSYGTERVTFYRMSTEMGPPETTTWEFPMADDSWERETNEFVADIRERRTPCPGITEAAAVLEIVESVYRQCR